jgi:hypothetical protein
LNFFAEIPSPGSRQRLSLPRALGGSRQTISAKKIFAECPRSGHSAKAPS